MSERDFIFWLQGFLVGKEALDINDIKFIEDRIIRVFEVEQDKSELTLAEVIRRASQ